LQVQILSNAPDFFSFGNYFGNFKYFKILFKLILTSSNAKFFNNFCTRFNLAKNNPSVELMVVNLQHPSSRRIEKFSIFIGVPSGFDLSNLISFFVSPAKNN
jgi:hypothetical protein